MSYGFGDWLGDLGDALNPKNWFSDYDGDWGAFGDDWGDFHDFWDEYTGKKIAEENLDFQKEVFQYQRWLNSKNRFREDHAVERRVKDLKRSGLNPILAASGAGAVSAPLKSAPAPQMGDYSGGVREGVSSLFNGAMRALQMRKDFAQQDASISLMKSQKSDVDASVSLKNAEESKALAEAERIRQETKYGDDYYRLRNANMELERAYKDGTLHNRIKIVSQEYDINEKKKLSMDLERLFTGSKIKGQELDNKIKIVEERIKKLEESGKYTENQILDKKLELMTQELLRASLEFDIVKDKKKFYDAIGLPYEFNVGSLANLVTLLSASSVSVSSELYDYIASILVGDSGEPSPRSFSKAELKSLLKRPEGSNVLWTNRMNKNDDYGVRRNF